MNEKLKIKLSVDEIIDEMTRVFTIITEAGDIPFYLFQNDESRFLYISSAFSEFTTISYSDLKSVKITNFSHLLHQEDLLFLGEIIRKSGELLRDYRLSGEDLGRTVFSVNLRIKTADGEYQYIDHQSYPVFLNYKEMPIISANIVKPSHKKGIDSLTFYSSGKNIRLLYSRKLKKFVPESKMLLKEVEIEILRLSSEGFIEKQIHDKLGVNPSMVNYHKREIFNKLNVTSIQEAVYVALISKLI